MVAPTRRGNADDYHNKGVGREAIRKSMKTPTGRRRKWHRGNREVDRHETLPTRVFCVNAVDKGVSERFGVKAVDKGLRA